MSGSGATSSGTTGAITTGSGSGTGTGTGAGTGATGCAGINVAATAALYAET